MTIKFTTDELQASLLKQFKYGRDLEIKFEGKQLVETKRSGGCFVKQDYNGAPALSDKFIRFMDENDSGSIPYDKALNAWEELAKQDPQASQVLEWYVFERSKDKDQMWLADKMGYTDRNIRYLKKRGLEFLAEALVSGVKTVCRPQKSPIFLSA